MSNATGAWGISGSEARTTSAHLLSNKRPTSVSFPRSSRKEVLFTDSILIALRKSTGWGWLKPNGQGKGILKYKASFLRELFLVLFLQANSGFYLSGPR